MENKKLVSIEKEIDELHTELQKLDNDRTTWEDSFDEYQRKREPFNKRLRVLDRKQRMLVEPTFKPLPDYGDVMSLADFKECCIDGMFMNYDGIGFYVRDNMESDIAIRPSDFKANSIRPDFDTIVWYNR